MEFRMIDQTSETVLLPPADGVNTFDTSQFSVPPDKAAVIARAQRRLLEAHRNPMSVVRPDSKH